MGLKRLFIEFLKFRKTAGDEISNGYVLFLDGLYHS